MDRQSVLLWIESGSAFNIANFKDRKSSSGFYSAVFQVVNCAPVGDATARPTDGRWSRLKVF
jgi:hypothetical protein